MAEASMARGGKPKSIDFAMLAAELRAHPRFRRHSTASFAAYRRDLRELGEVLGVATVAEIGPDAPGRWVRAMMARNLRPRSIRTRFETLGRLLDVAVQAGHLDANPFRSGVEGWMPPDYQGRDPERIPELGEADAARLMAHLKAGSRGWRGGRLYALASTVLLAGLRPGEATRLRVTDCYLDRRTIIVDGRRATRREKPMSPLLAEILESWMPRTRSEWLFPGTRLQGPWLTGGPRFSPLGQLKAAAQEIGLGWVTFESLQEHWRRCGGAVELGEAFRHERAPSPDDLGPSAGRKPESAAEAERQRRESARTSIKKYSSRFIYHMMIDWRYNFFSNEVRNMYHCLDSLMNFIGEGEKINRVTPRAIRGWVRQLIAEKTPIQQIDGMINYATYFMDYLASDRTILINPFRDRKDWVPRGHRSQVGKPDSSYPEIEAAERCIERPAEGEPVRFPHASKPYPGDPFFRVLVLIWDRFPGGVSQAELEQVAASARRMIRDKRSQDPDYRDAIIPATVSNGKGYRLRSVYEFLRSRVSSG